MPFNFLKDSFIGRKVLPGVLEQAQAVFAAYVWDTANIRDDGITTAKILDANVTAAKLASDQFGGDYIKLTDTKATTVNGGASIAGTQTRVLNTEDSDTGNHCTLSSNQFTLATGTYQTNITVSAYRVDQHQAWLQNISDSTTEIVGTSEIANAATIYSQTRSIIFGEFSIASPKIFEVQHYTAAVKTVNGLGVASSSGKSEIYTMVELHKVK